MLGDESKPTQEEPPPGFGEGDMFSRTVEEIAATERDGARYRWLRDHQDCLPDLSGCSRPVQARTLDAFIDAEIEADREHGRAKR